MAGADQITPPQTVLPQAGNSNLVLRILSSLVMAPLALGVAYVGDQVFLLFWTIAALVVLWEWDGMVCTHDKNPVFAIGSIAIVGTSLLWAMSRPVLALILISLGALGVSTLATKVRRSWSVVGLAYAAVLLVAPVVLRADPMFGFRVIVLVFAVVWSTDVLAYVVGRTFGGPKLIPRISPNKTWAGAIGGLAAGIGAGIAVAKYFGMEDIAAISLVAFLLSVASQSGDVLESAVKRQFNVKDASWLIPGHGGLMDRLDGFMAASLLAVIIGLAHGGAVAPGRGLLVW